MTAQRRHCITLENYKKKVKHVSANTYWSQHGKEKMQLPVYKYKWIILAADT